MSEYSRQRALLAKQYFEAHSEEILALAKKMYDERTGLDKLEAERQKQAALRQRKRNKYLRLK